MTLQILVNTVAPQIERERESLKTTTAVSFGIQFSVRWPKMLWVEGSVPQRNGLSHVPNVIIISRVHTLRKHKALYDEQCNTNSGEKIK